MKNKLPRNIAIIDEDKRWEIQEKILDMLFDSDLSPLEMVGLLELCKLEVKDIVDSFPCEHCKKGGDEDGSGSEEN